MGQKVRLSEAELKNYVTENIKKVLNELNNTYSDRTYKRALVKYTISKRGVLEERKYDNQDRLVRVYQQIISQYKRDGARVVKARFVGYGFTFVIDKERGRLVLLAIVPGGALTGRALLQRVQNSKAELSNMLHNWGCYNLHIFGLRNSYANQQVNGDEANNIMEEQVYGNSLLSVLATVAQYMEDFGYDEESQLIENI